MKKCKNEELREEQEWRLTLFCWTVSLVSRTSPRYCSGSHNNGNSDETVSDSSSSILHKKVSTNSCLAKTKKITNTSKTPKLVIQKKTPEEDIEELKKLLEQRKV